MSDQTGHKVVAEGDGTDENRLIYLRDDGKSYDIEDMVDALDHIMRVSRQANTITKRLKMIELRAKSALDGTEEWRDYDYPRNRAGQRENLRKRFRELQTELADTRRYAEEALNGWRVGDDIVGPMRRLQEFLE